MNTLKKILFTTVLIIGCSLFAFGQSNDDKKQDPPPKKDVPKIEPKDKPPPTPTPKPKPNLVEAGLEVRVKIDL